MQLPGDALYLIGGLALLLGAVLPAALSRRALSVPMAFVGAGVLVGLLPLPGGAPISPVEQPAVAERLTELCVIVALMGVGLAIDRPLSLRTWAPTWRLLAIGMPLFVVVAAVLGWWWLGLAPAAALLLGAVLSPTDPVLASDVQVAGPQTRDEGTSDDESVDEGDAKDEVDEDDETRFALTSEAGLNDGLAFPFVYAAIFLAAIGTAEEHSWWRWLGWELVGKVLLGALIGWGAGGSWPGWPSGPAPSPCAWRGPGNRCSRSRPRSRSTGSPRWSAGTASSASSRARSRSARTSADRATTTRCTPSSASSSTC